MMVCRKCGREVEPCETVDGKPAWSDVQPRDDKKVWSRYFVCDPGQPGVGAFPKHPETWHEGADVFFLTVEKALDDTKTA